MKALGHLKRVDGVDLDCTQTLEEFQEFLEKM